MRISALIFSLLAMAPAWASHISAQRLPGLPAAAYFPSEKGWSSSAFGRKQPFESLDLNAVPSAPDLNFIQNKFNSVRDRRFLKASGSDFLRRITWLYPDDGCYARAEVLARLLDQEQAPPVAKIFIFGDLNARTPNSPQGNVSWWYHVAAAYRDRNEVYVLDPAVEPKRPLPLKQWIRLISPRPQDAELSICSSRTYEPDSDCLDPDPQSNASSWAEQQRYLPKEWRRLKELGRVPEKELGDFPPWR